MTKKFAHPWIALLLFLANLLLLSSCQTPIPLTQKSGATAGLANPATEKCLKDGYLSQPLMTNGVPTGGLCVDKANNRACEEWAYYRGECQFDTVAPSKPSSQKKVE